MKKYILAFIITLGVFLLGMSYSYYQTQSTRVEIYNEVAATFGGGGGGGTFGSGSDFTTLSISRGGSGTGSPATSTMSLGEFGNNATTTSVSCINMRNSVGATSSVYIVGTTLTVEAGACK